MHNAMPRDRTDRRVSLLNGRFDPLTMDETIDRVAALLESDQRSWLCTVNVAILMMMREDPELHRFVERATICVADGQPLVWLSRLKRTPLPERVAGIELIEAVAARAEQKDWGLYLLGATPEAVNRAAEALARRHPALRLCGIDDGYFSGAQAGDRARAVRESGADILFVAMGVPYQEQFISQNWGALGVRVAIPVGGSFDVLAGLRRRAPVWIQRLGLEWAFRVGQEPRRLWKRYLVTNMQFLWLAARDLTGL